MFLEAAKLWDSLVQEPDIDRPTRTALNRVFEVLASPAEKLKRSGIELRSAVVWVTERARGATRHLGYEVTLVGDSRSCRFLWSTPERIVPGVHFTDHELRSSNAIDDAVMAALIAWDTEFGLLPDVEEDLRWRLETWCLRYFRLKEARGQYLAKEPLLILVLAEVAEAMGLDVPTVEETRALALVATKHPPRASSSPRGAAQSENDRWRKAFAAFPSWRSQMTPEPLAKTPP